MLIGDIEEVDSSSAPIPQPEETVTGNDSTELEDLSEQTTAPAIVVFEFLHLQRNRLRKELGYIRN